MNRLATKESIMSIEVNDGWREQDAINELPPDEVCRQLSRALSLMIHKNGGWAYVYVNGHTLRVTYCRESPESIVIGGNSWGPLCLDFTGQLSSMRVLLSMRSTL